MISHFTGNPQGPSLSFSVFCWGCDEGAAAGVVDDLFAGAAVVPLAVVAPFVAAAVFFSPSSSHWGVLAMAS